jgi:hypothetical protein
MSDTPDKITVDMRHMTPRLLAGAGEILGMSIMEAMQGAQQPMAIAAIAAYQNPDMDFDALADTDLTDYDIIGQEADPKAPGANNGAAPQPSLASGV